LGSPPPKKLATQNITILAQFWILQLDRKYLRIGTRYHLSENGVAIYEHSHTCLLNLLNIGPQTVKNRTVDWSNQKSRF